ncbi:hypothetical protein BB8028_0003g00630 [Beauveria bassiana]|uniref:BRCT domain-containing protein n=2 Tax=Beauveria bassiana TaxID=176275 RepID=A0A0A2VY87_BEABA|nr:hypothetical protein BBAD15_g9076 [Beauveria bassiana D1-5]PQK11437.1 hypothetical protein BB8028_0003g00630 [Beauveria bassiana]
MKTYTNLLPKPPPSSHPRPFDPWNSSSTGHQRREASRRETDGVSETSWRASRALKINQQLKTQSHVPPPPPPASQDGKLAQRQPKSVMDMLVRPGSMKETMSASSSAAAVAAAVAEASTEKEKETEVARRNGESAGQSLIFAGLVVHVNGSTAPLVSDYKLKTLLAAHGARVALHLARRHVTHVVLGRPAGSISGGGSSAGCGGGLAGTKMDREIRRRGGNGIKYVGVEWVLESIRVGRRLPEARFANLDIAPHRQSSVYSLSKKPA